MITAIAVDDEPKALQIIEHHAKQVHDLKLLQSFTQAEDVICFLKENSVDVVFMDINMPKLSGIDLLNAINHQPNVIFTTAYAQYAIDSYEHKTIDYLLKPITFERFERAIAKLREQLVLQTSKSYCFLKDGAKLVKLNFDDILFIKGAGNYLEIQTKNDLVLPRMVFSDILHLLPSGKFVRVHQSFIVSLQHIEQIENNHIYIGEVQIPISKKYKQAFYAMISG